jgi:hypothetical protein
MNWTTFSYCLIGCIALATAVFAHPTRLQCIGLCGAGIVTFIWGIGQLELAAPLSLRVVSAVDRDTEH